MLISLQSELLENIRQAYPNSRSLDDLFAISDMLGHKQSLCERKLRILVHSGLITVIKDFKGQNYAYKFVKIEEPLISMKNFKIGIEAIKNCKNIDYYPPLQEKIQNKLFEMRIPLN